MSDERPQRSAMTRRFGALWWLSGLFRIAGPTRMSDGAAEHIREAMGAGPVIYVLPRRSRLDLLALNAALVSRGLPLASWAPAVDISWVRPLSEAWAALRGGGTETDPDVAAPASLTESGTICLFAEAGTWSTVPGLAGLTGIARALPKAVVVPLVVMWDRSPDLSDPVRSFFLGKQGLPSIARRWWNALRGADRSVHAGRPIELEALIERVGPERLEGVLARMVRRSAHQETRVVRGPVLLPPGRMKRVVLETPAMRDFAREEAAREGTSVERIQRRMAKEYDRIAARFSWTIVMALHLLLQPLWTRVFSGVDAEEGDIAAIRSAIRDGSAVLVPCHKSHFDYVLLSWVLYHHDMVIPHVVAGMNLAIWPLSILLRGAGGFFVRRSFKGDRVFPAVFARYVRELVLREYPVEFFPEGGRTRSGKLLPPKVGVLGMVMDAAEVRSHDREVTLLPIALAYEQVAEEAAYARELGGEEKRPESMLELLKARKVLRRRFGRVYLRVGEPIRCGEIVDADDDRPAWSERSAEERKVVLQATGERIIHRIGQRTVLLPTSLVALALLALPRRGVRHDELMARVRRMAGFLEQAGTPGARSLQRFDQAVSMALDRFVRDGRVRAHTTGEQRIWEVVPEERITLDFYKNQVLHWFAAAGVAACAIRSLPDDTFHADRIAPAFHQLRRLWRREFVWDPDRSEEQLLRDGLDDLRAYGAIRDLPDGGHRVADPVQIGEIYGLFRPLLEGYLAVLGARSYGSDPRALPAAIQSDKGARLPSGAITRPESLSLVTLSNAAAVLAEDGALTTGAAADAHRELLGPMAA
ncbi:MAG: 1-acyl-sn-glycerol-3-phosphate acyltransferase [Myxococcales bacterium]|nr:1-acyl-sn-glycerol-3-phosphate acyltransferase [Myxococcales bacterium]